MTDDTKYTHPATTISNCTFNIQPSIDSDTIDIIETLAAAAKINSETIRQLAELLSNKLPNNVTAIKVEQAPYPYEPPISDVKDESYEDNDDQLELFI